jgi:hypothetical protein
VRAAKPLAVLAGAAVLAGGFAASRSVLGGAEPAGADNAQARALIDEGDAHLKLTSISYPQWLSRKYAPGVRETTEWYLAFQSFDAAKAALEEQPPTTAPTTTEPPTTSPPPTTEPPPVPVANVWVDADGGSCTDLDPPGPYSDAGSCLPDAANDTCDNGDLILYRAGVVYQGVQFSGSNGRTAPCQMRGENGPIRFSGDVHFGASGGDGPDWITMTGVQCGDPASYLNEADVTVWDATANLVMDGWDCASFDVFSDGGVTISGGDWGPCGSSATRKCVPRVARSNVKIIGNSFHDIACGNGSGSACDSFHTDGLAVFGGANVTVSGNKFYRNDIVNIRFQACCGNTPLANLKIENNWFGPQCVTGTTTWTPCSLGIRGGGFDIDTPVACGTIAGNSFSTGGGITVQTSMGTAACPVNVTGNAITVTNNCGGNAIYCYNASRPWSEFQGQTPCGQTDRRVTGFGYVQEDAAAIDFHVTATSPVLDLVAAGSCLSTDIDGQPRSAPCDAGSDER